MGAASGWADGEVDVAYKCESGETSSGARTTESDSENLVGLQVLLDQRPVRGLVADADDLFDCLAVAEQQ